MPGSDFAESYCSAGNWPNSRLCFHQRVSISRIDPVNSKPQLSIPCYESTTRTGGNFVFRGNMTFRTAEKSVGAANRKKGLERNSGWKEIGFETCDSTEWERNCCFNTNGTPAENTMYRLVFSSPAPLAFVLLLCPAVMTWPVLRSM